MNTAKELRTVLLKRMPSSHEEIVAEFKYEDLIAGGIWFKYKPYSNESGNDVKSLKAEIIESKGCEFDVEPEIRLKYDFTCKRAFLRINTSTIRPNKECGYIIIKATGNYKFQQFLRLPWKIQKETLGIKDFIHIGDTERTLIWKNGEDLLVTNISLSLSDIIKKKIIWYELPKISIRIEDSSNKEFHLTNSTLSFNESKCEIKYLCKGVIQDQKEEKIKIIFYANDKKVDEKIIKICFEPLICNISPKLSYPLNNYELGTPGGKLALLKLSNDTKNTIGKVKIEIECNNDIVYCDCKQYVNVEYSKEKTVDILIDNKKLTYLPEENIEVKLLVTSYNKYTKVKDNTFTETFILKVKE